MCYSAMVQQNVKALSLKFGARVDLDFFEELYTERLKGQSLTLSPQLDASFLSDLNTPQEKKIASLIQEWQRHEKEKLQETLIKQKERLSAAEEKLKIKPTKNALNEQRIATDKIQWLQKKIETLETNSAETKATEGRIFPFHYAPLLIVHQGERLIRPYRYHLRPHTEGPEFDRKFDGTYNVRRDSLDRVAWWKRIYGKNHGLLVVTRFYENVFDHRSNKNHVIEFTPHVRELFVPCLYDENTMGKDSLHSFAILTDLPHPDVAKAGHERTLIHLNENRINDWINTTSPESKNFDLLLDDRPTIRFASKID